MARQGEALIKRVLTPLNSGVELFFAESRLAFCPADDTTNTEEEQLITLLVSFGPPDVARWSARAFAATLVAANCTFQSLADTLKLAEKLSELLDNCVAGSLCVVFALPDYSEFLSHQITQFLETVRTRGQHQLNLAVAVCDRPHDWCQCQGIDGFVAADTGQKNRSALATFHVLTSLMSPGLLNCVDAEDLRGVFGTAKLPCRVTNGVWMTEDASFHLASADEHQRLKSYKAIAFMASTEVKFSSLVQLLNTLRRAATPDVDFVMISPFGMSSEPLMGNQIIPVTLICR